MEQQTNEQLDAMTARGDLAVLALQALRTSSQQGQVRLLQLVQRLQKLNMPMRTEDGKPSLGAMIMDELDIINTTLTNSFNISNTAVEELNALAQSYGLGKSTEQTIETVIGYIKKSSTAYGSKTDEEIRKEFGV